MTPHVKYVRLRSLASDYRIAASTLTQLRMRRDALALELVESGETWRKVAEAAGFENPYLAQLKRKAAAQPEGAPDE